MITTVTLNPSFDLTLEVDSVALGQISRANAERLDAAGKGVNVAQALAANGIATRALAAIDPSAAQRYTDLLDAPEVLTILPVHGLVRTNVALVEPAGVVTKVNGPGPTHDAHTIRSLLDAIAVAAQGSSWLVLSGSLPPGCPDDTYARLVQAGHASACRVAVDAEGEALRHGVEAGPDLVKPNRTELQQLTGIDLNTVGDVIAAAEVLLAWGARLVLCSLGPDGAVLVAPDGAIRAAGPPLTVDSHVGAGDAFLAGFLAAGDDLDAICHAVAWGGAACRLPGSKMPGPADIRLAEIAIDHNPDPAIALTPRQAVTTSTST